MGGGLTLKRVGIWPIMDTVLAKRNANNLKKGTPIMKPATVSRERCKTLIFKEVIAAGTVGMPRPPGHRIFVHLDGAKRNIGNGVMEAIQGAARGVALDTQPGNPPDVDVNDLGLCHPIQPLKENVRMMNGEELAEGTMKAFNAPPGSH
ncbi:unnamed protein product [Discosporangium mesarthrocarpum]